MAPNNVLTFATTGDYSPFTVKDGTSPVGYSGIDIDVAQEICNTLSSNLSLYQINWSEVQSSLSLEPIVGVICGLTITKERQSWSRMSQPYLKSESVVICRQADFAHFTKLPNDAFKKLKICVNKGGYLESQARTKYEFDDILTTTENSKLPLLLEQGVCQLILSDSLEAKHFTRIAAVKVVKTMEDQFHGILIGRNNLHLGDPIDQALNDMKFSGKLDRIISRHLGPLKT